MDIPDALRLAPSADLYRLYLTIGRMINDPKRILEVRRHLHIGMTVGYVADDLTQPVRRGRILELRQTQAVVQDTTSGRHWILPYAAVLAEPTRRLRGRSQIGERSRTILFMLLSEQEQLLAGNAFMRRLAQQMNPANPALGQRQVIRLMDAGESLSQHFDIDRASLLPTPNPVRPLPAGHRALTGAVA
ncbi:putative membrane protein (plasmid) [Cupriavidus necator H850]|uniref:hypothetical protein n=1 Tax=Cupriavidus necator TaxID=106590 RepID=UPI001E2B28DE|nr:putative membrane protein [Cupriavidus necator H850]